MIANQALAEQVQRRLALGRQYDTRQALVICKPDGRPYRPDSASTMFRVFVDGLGLPWTVHVNTLRHSAVSFLRHPAGSGRVRPGLLERRCTTPNVRNRPHPSGPAGRRMVEA
jgi:hypothetical protein